MDNLFRSSDVYTKKKIELEWNNEYRLWSKNVFEKMRLVKICT